MDAKPKKSRFLIYTLELIILICFIAYAYVSIDAQINSAHRSQTISSMRSFSLGLYEFARDFESYPSDATVSKVNESYPDHDYDLSGSSSNALFLQLFATNIIKSEENFYAKIRDSIKPDGDITSGNALSKGECGFAYITGLSLKDDPKTPLVLTPLIPGTTKFDPKPFGGKAIIQHIDNSSVTYDIHKDGHVYIDGIDILSPTNPIWKGKAPDIRYPE